MGDGLQDSNGFMLAITLEQDGFDTTGQVLPQHPRWVTPRTSKIPARDKMPRVQSPWLSTSFSALQRSVTYRRRPEQNEVAWIGVGG